VSAPVARTPVRTPHGPYEPKSPEIARHGVSEEGDVHENVWIRLAALHAQMAEVYRELAETELAVSPDQCVMETMSERHNLLTVSDLADTLRVDPKTVRRWRTDGLLPVAFEIGGVIRWRAEDVDAWLEGQR